MIDNDSRSQIIDSLSILPESVENTQHLHRELFMTQYIMSHCDMLYIQFLFLSWKILSGTGIRRKNAGPLLSSDDRKRDKYEGERFTGAERPG